MGWHFFKTSAYLLSNVFQVNKRLTKPVLEKVELLNFRIIRENDKIHKQKNCIA